MESEDDSVQFEESDNECPDDDNFLWEKLAIMTSISNDPIEVFGGFIYLYMQSEYDELFNQMMDRISNAINKPIAIEHTIDENYDTIVEHIKPIWPRGGGKIARQAITFKKSRNRKKIGIKYFLSSHKI